MFSALVTKTCNGTRMTVLFSCRIVLLLWCSGRLSDWKRLNSDRFEGFGVCEGRWNVIFPIQSHWISGKNRKTLEEDIMSSISTLRHFHQNPLKLDVFNTKVQAKIIREGRPAIVCAMGQLPLEWNYRARFSITPNCRDTRSVAWDHVDLILSVLLPKVTEISTEYSNSHSSCGSSS